MGFNAIWFSPVTKHTPQGYHGYYQTDLYSLNEHFGTAQDLKDLSNALNRRSMYLMVDVVTNHFGSETTDTDIDYSAFYPFNSSYYFHDYCAVDYNNQTSAVMCWLDDNLVDVRTEDQNVVDAFSTWIKELVSNYSVDGLRIDSVKDVDKASMEPFCQAAGVYCLGELSNGNADYAYPYQSVLNGGGIINYPLYDAFNQTFLYNLSSTEDLAYAIYLDRNNSIESTLHGTFTENHDNPRIACANPDITVAANAIGFTILTHGISIIYQGQEQHLDGGDDPYCREAMWLGENGGFNTSALLYATVKKLNAVRQWAINHTPDYLSSKNFALNYSADQIAMRKGLVRTILTFAGEGQANATFTTKGAEFVPGLTVVDLISC
jgi:alpha-amylase